MDFSSRHLSTNDVTGLISYLGILENLNASDLDINDFIENPFAKKELTTSIEKWGGSGHHVRRSYYEASPYGYASEEIDLSPKADTKAINISQTWIRVLTNFV